MLLGRVEAPLPTAPGRGVKPRPAHSGLAGLAGLTGLTGLGRPNGLNTPNGLDDIRLAAELASAGRTAMWARLGPYDLDPTSLAALAGAMLATSPPVPPRGLSPTVHDGSPSNTRVVVIEAAGPRPNADQVETFLAQLGTAWPHPQTRLDVLLHHHSQTCLPGEPAARSEFGSPGRFADPTRTALAARLISELGPQTRTALHLAALLGYCHQRFDSLEPVITECAAMPWWIPLTGNWWQVEWSWRPEILAVCDRYEPPGLSALTRLVSELIEDGAGDEAIELCLEAGAGGLASDLLSELGPRLLRADRPRAVARWIDLVPAEERDRHRQLTRDLTRLNHRHRKPSGRRWWPLGHRDATDEPTDLGVMGELSELGEIGRPPGLDGLSGLSGLGGLGPTTVALNARLFGRMEVSVGGDLVQPWHSRKGRVLLAHLLLHRGQPVPREVLETALWPEATADAARNRLHVTLHALRRDLRTVALLPVVVFERGYILNPELNVDLDIESFEKAMADGRTAMRNEEREASLTHFREAIAFYRADLLTEQTDEDWTMLPREHLRVGMLDARAAVARLAFDLGRYAECVLAGQELLDLDFCREDLHQLLIRAYARLHQPELAIRQFGICAEQMQAQFAMRPAIETVRLLERVRSRAPV